MASKATATAEQRALAEIKAQAAPMSGVVVPGNAVSWADYEKRLTLGELQALNRPFYLIQLSHRTQPMLDPATNTMNDVLWAMAKVVDAESGEWLGDLSTTGAFVAPTLKRMADDNVPAVGPLVCVNKGQRGGIGFAPWEPAEPPF